MSTPTDRRNLDGPTMQLLGELKASTEAISKSLDEHKEIAGEGRKVIHKLLEKHEVRMLAQEVAQQKTSKKIVWFSGVGVGCGIALTYLGASLLP